MRTFEIGGFCEKSCTTKLRTAGSPGSAFHHVSAGPEHPKHKQNRFQVWVLHLHNFDGNCFWPIPESIYINPINVSYFSSNLQIFEGQDATWWPGEGRLILDFTRPNVLPTSRPPFRVCYQRLPGSRLPLSDAKQWRFCPLPGLWFLLMPRLTSTHWASQLQLTCLKKM